MQARNKKWIAGGAVLALGVVAIGATAFADRGGRHGFRGPGMQSMMERYDANKDGRLSQDEINTNRTTWHAEFDKDKSNDLSIAEFEALWLKARREEMVREYQRFDRDGDGKVTLQEYQEPLATLVASMDANNDGVLSKDDREMRRRHMRGDDRPGDDDDRGDDN